jgi:flagellar L-ring protein precursor FlgH
MKPLPLLLGLLTLSTLGWASAPGSIVPTDHEGRVNSIFSDPIAYRIGEPITVVVNLSSVATASRSLNSAKTSGITEGTLTSPLIPNELVNNYGFNMSGNTSHTGTGNLADNQTMTTTFTGKIVEVLSNGCYKIEARRKITIGKEKSEIILTGVVRSWDIGATNQVNSTVIADMEIEQKGTGPISRSTDKGWLTELYEFLAPF